VVSPLDTVVDWVCAHGANHDQAHAIAHFVADRCAGLTIASAHSSGHSSLRQDPYLVHRLRLNRRQISAWLALIRGTRPITSKGRTVGGRPGLIEMLVAGELESTDRRRFERLAHVAATGRLPRPGQGCCL
jgi:hypothetical protein